MMILEWPYLLMLGVGQVRCFWFTLKPTVKLFSRGESVRSRLTEPAIDLD